MIRLYGTLGHLPTFSGCQPSPVLGYQKMAICNQMLTQPLKHANPAACRPHLQPLMACDGERERDQTKPLELPVQPSHTLEVMETDANIQEPSRTLHLNGTSAAHSVTKANNRCNPSCLASSNTSPRQTCPQRRQPLQAQLPAFKLCRMCPTAL